MTRPRSPDKWWPSQVQRQAVWPQSGLLATVIYSSPGGSVQLLRQGQLLGNGSRNVSGSLGLSLFSFIALSETTPNPPGK